MTRVQLEHIIRAACGVTRSAARHSMADRSVLVERLVLMNIADTVRARIRVHIDHDYAA